MGVAVGAILGGVLPLTDLARLASIQDGMRRPALASGSPDVPYLDGNPVSDGRKSLSGTIRRSWAWVDRDRGG